MIAFDLQCSKGHTFEGWFDDGATYAEQLQKGLITCPVCSDPDISKIPSTFAIKSSPKPMPPQAGAQATRLPEAAKLEHQIRQFVETNFDDVGCDFAKEALKIHYGVTKERNIRGVSTEAEEEALRTEGVPFIKFPSAKKSEE